ncbi:MAG: hypothetical protein LBG97_08240 [Coriobacteriales bacterium]|jgi:hypothetical protein|nr:hypothetical protein [Coriobacteriales bacterium]
MTNKEQVKIAERYIRKTGDYGIVPQLDASKRFLTGLRYIPELKKRLGRDITNEEWESMSIR